MKYKLVAFDVDGTLVDNIVFSWQLLHDYFKTDEEKRAKIRTKYYNGEISYLEWANHDLNLWVEKKAKKQDFFNALKQNDVKLMNGALETLNALKEAANALEMELVYGFKPKKGTIFKMIDEAALKKATEIVMRTSKTMELEDQKVNQERLNQAIKDKAKEITSNLPKYLWD